MEIRTLIIKAAKFVGATGLAAHLNNKQGSALLDQFTSAISKSKAHAKECDEIAKLRTTKALNIKKKADKKAQRLEDRAYAKKYYGGKKASKVQDSAKAVKESGQKSMRFANNLERIVE